MNDNGQRSQLLAEEIERLEKVIALKQIALERLEDRVVVIITDNPAAVTCTCVLCQFHREVSKAFAAKVDREVMALCDDLNK